MFDIVFPNKNEKKFIELAQALGFKGLIFAYSSKGEFKELKQFKTKIKLFNAVITTAKKVQSAKNNINLVLVQALEDSREILEKHKPDIIFALESAQKKDFIHQRGSGLNHILCKIAQKNNILIGFSFNSILNSDSRSKLIGKIMQNIRFCRKFKNNTLIASFAKNPFEMRSPHDLVSFFVSIGMHPKEAKDSLNSVLSKIRENLQKKQGLVKGISFQ